jgi:hypothetical protein
MITGCGFYGLLIAQITSIVAEAESNRRLIAERVDAIASYVHAKDLNPVLQKEILVYFRKFLKKNSVVDEWQILRDLSSGLRGQVINHLMTGVITKNPFFMHLQHHIAELFHIMHLQFIDRGQHVTRKGQLSRDMMVMLVGSAVILDESEESVRAGQGDPMYPLYEVTPGAIFGERCALNLDDSYNTTVRALTNCEFYVIFSDELLATLGKRLFNGLRRKCTTDAIFKVRLRTYGISNIPDETMGMLRKMMTELPPDPHKRTWSRRIKSKSHTKGRDDDDDDDDDEDDGKKKGKSIDQKAKSIDQNSNQDEDKKENQEKKDESQKNVNENDNPKVVKFLDDKSNEPQGKPPQQQQEEERKGGSETEGDGGGIQIVDKRVISAEMDEKEIEEAETFDILLGAGARKVRDLSTGSLDGGDSSFKEVLVDMNHLTDKVEELSNAVKEMQVLMEHSQAEQKRQQNLYSEQMEAMMEMLKTHLSNTP